jgi:3-oxoacyl-[acyl-carrier-protein] synthase II
VPGRAREQSVDVVLSNSFGFGGVNACVLFRKLAV